MNVVRCFEDENVIHVNGHVDPIADIETIGIELALADLATAEKTPLAREQEGRAGDKDAQKLAAVLESCCPPQ